MRPLPPFTVRPLKRRDDRKNGLSASVLRESADSFCEEMSVKAGRLAIKATAGRDKPRLKVLERSTE